MFGQMGRDAVGAPISDTAARDLTRIFDTIEYPEAFRITYLANAIVFPAYALIKRDFGLVRAEYILLV